MRRNGTISLAGIAVLFLLIGGVAPARAWQSYGSLWVSEGGVSLGIERVSHGGAFDPWFVEPLEGYGRWVFVPAFEGPVWVPRVDVAWRPYFRGHWSYTTIGMMWVAYEPWGWLTHHYGRWVWLDEYGWAWTPGYDYAPAWVTWVAVDDYVGWAPLPPDGYRYPRRSHYRYDGPGYFGRSPRTTIVDIDLDIFVFVSNEHFCGADVYRHALPAHRTEHYFKSKRVVPIGRELDDDHVRRVAGGKVRPARVEQSSYRAGERRIVDYQPAGEETRIRKARETYAREAYTPDKSTRERNTQGTYSRGDPDAREKSNRAESRAETPRSRIVEPEKQRAETKKSIAEPKRQGAEPRARVSEPKARSAEKSRESAPKSERGKAPEKKQARDESDRSSKKKR
ncbi:MAG: hypothetical protein EHM19_06440 [Candidatus Latescibacterota bacterium]|nr:MAG: hypothetical protein EHM19_06440 [Candidatus Latescibacterota bacterium]